MHPIDGRPGRPASWTRRAIAHVLASSACLTVLSAFAISPSQSAPRLQLVTAAAPPLGPDEDSIGFAGEIASEAFRRLGIDVDVAALPAERAMASVNDGLDDADILRIEGIDQKYRNLVRVPETVMSFDFVGYTNRADVAFDGWAQLSRYALGYVQGWRIYETNSPSADVTIARDLPQLFAMLEAGRIDVALADRWQGLYVLRKQRLQARLVEPPLATQLMYIYLNSRHAALVEPLARRLAEIKRDGTYERIFAARLAPLSGGAASR